ncbi:MAG: 2-C-methyl-D-erythritol 4-phosphate cytidylyltransferase [Anaerolineales bacterium]|nr:2-C-methyl-D-erythritol 4-phosphate cytidylyltransferase [Chloroflexota bacterium]MBL6981085.1 2-C-methyl-D-erythritol 4-phosphate cytidylyltransferase [Anaerolineales bacterium]
MSETLKIVIPMAGFGTRLRPHTWSRPKQLISLAGQSVLAHVLDMFSTLPNPENVEFIFIVGYLGDKVEAYMDEYHPEFKVRFVVQEEMRGQSHAIYLTKEYLSGPMLMVFADTLIETNLSFLKDEEADMVAWVKPVPDPRRFGVTEVGEDGWVKRLIEKPKDVSNNLAVVGFYYFKDSSALLGAIEEQMEQGRALKGEYYLADAINIMLEDGAKMRTERVQIWLDAGTTEAVLETNRYLLKHGYDNTAEVGREGNITVIPPVFVHPTAMIEASVIGPYASIGANCTIKNSVIRDSIIEKGSQVTEIILDGSLIGENVQVDGGAERLNVGDNSEVKM